jgi:chromosome segregation ATPase
VIEDASGSNLSNGPDLKEEDPRNTRTLRLVKAAVGREIRLRKERDNLLDLLSAEKKRADSLEKERDEAKKENARLKEGVQRLDTACQGYALGNKKLQHEVDSLTASLHSCRAAWSEARANMKRWHSDLVVEMQARAEHQKDNANLRAKAEMLNTVLTRSREVQKDILLTLNNNDLDPWSRIDKALELLHH